MTWLLLSILASSGILLLFRGFSDHGVHTRHAIMLNYSVAAITGFVIFTPTEHWFSQPWFLPAAAMGTLFYVIFRVMAKTAQENGVAVGVVVTKMSVIIPVVMGLTILDETISGYKIGGIILGLAAVLLTTKKGAKKGAWIWPLVLFVGSGAIDASLKLFQVKLLTDAQTPVFISTIFSFAFFSALIHHFFTAEKRVSGRSALGGLALGLVNFGSLYFILKALALPGMESSVVFPLNNFGIVLCSSLLAIILFKERPDLKVWLGLGLASCSIWLLYLSS